MTRKKKLFFESGSSCPGIAILLGMLLYIFMENVPTVGCSSEVGYCWKLRKRDGECGHIQRNHVTIEECCSGIQRRGWGSISSFNSSSSSSSSPSFSSSPSSSSSSSSSFNSVIIHQPKCTPCSTICHGVKCGEDRKCVVRCGAPRCVCSPQCHLKNKEPVCGSDGRTYSSECHLLKRACRKKKRVMVSHYGPCQTCSGVRCRGGKQCVLDEQMTPICIRCPTSCPKKDKRPLCAADERTYTSRCELKRASCRAGSLIPKAYMGACRDSPTCDTVRCWGNQTCLTSVETGQPQCTDCDSNSCLPSSRAVCASDGKKYPSWCAFRHEACRSGRALTPALHVHCKSNHTKADDCTSSGRYHKKLKKHRNRQRKMDEERKELLLKHETLTDTLLDLTTLRDDLLQENVQLTQGDTGGGGGGGLDNGSGQQLPEEKKRKIDKKISRKRKKCEKSRKRRRKGRMSKRERGLTSSP